MFVVLLRFSTEKPRAAEFMADHKSWLEQGFADEVFILSGSLQAAGGGLILAHNTTHTELQARVDRDPFVAYRVVEAEIVEVTPSRASESLNFLLA